ncbi:sugar-binding protein [Thalassotalea sp. M1531]|uniref:Sugar-binding protein n=1 Tax=Thalassotalea algicola TaxID=2716224 RepID=A0A7Y0Q6M0_9GAMM|nr:sugar-binding protein [Thalassotalea algicola]NMP31518.1 sugar-binding protein [Thalassotalea algicola]
MNKYLVIMLCGAMSLNAQGKNDIEAMQTVVPINVDGVPNEVQWQKAQWLPMKEVMLGESPSTNDFNGKYKLLWDKEHVYLLARIVDDVLYDRYSNPLENYWDDDCLEVFIDEDNSGGQHLNNFNAFAYHVALDNQVVDIAPIDENQGAPKLFNHHVNSRWQRSSEPDNAIYWELAIKLFRDDAPYDLSNDVKVENQYRVTNKVGKKLGFMLAYCDNDGSKYREHFVGSTAITPVNGDKNLGYKTADVFDTLTLIKPN